MVRGWVKNVSPLDISAVPASIDSLFNNSTITGTSNKTLTGYIKELRVAVLIPIKSGLQLRMLRYAVVLFP